MSVDSLKELQMLDTSFWGPIVSWVLLPVITTGVVVTSFNALKAVHDQKLMKIQSLKKLIWSLDSRVATNSSDDFNPPSISNGSPFSRIEFHDFTDNLMAELHSSNWLDEDEMPPDAISILISRYGRLCDLSGEFNRLAIDYDRVSLGIQGKPHDMANQDYEFLLRCTDLWMDALTRFHDSVSSMSRNLDKLVTWNPLKKCKLQNVRKRQI